ncbi:MAG: hypothetical protein ACI30B_01780 [Paludibacteraceae bacterium]
MVRFEKDRLVIEIQTHGRPVEYWMELQRGLLDMLRYTTQETLIEETFYTVPDFLRELMPDYETLAKMQND